MLDLTFLLFYIYGCRLFNLLDKNHIFVVFLEKFLNELCFYLNLFSEGIFSANAPLI